MSESEKLGFIGLGIMGFPMAENLLKAGYAVTVFNRTRQRAEELATRGAVVADSPAEVARQARVIFLCLGASDSVCQVAETLFKEIHPGSVVVDCSPISPAVSRQLA